MRKKGQFEIQETVLVIFIFTVILIIGISFYYRYLLDSIRQDAQLYEDFKFKVGLSNIISMAEVRCSFLGEQKECIDLDKAGAFASYSKDYFSLFGYRNITLYVVYPLSEQSSINIYYRKPALSKSISRVSSPVLVYDSFDSDYKIGLIVMERYT